MPRIGRNAHREALAAHRAEVCARIAVLLVAGPMSVADISDAVGIRRSTGQSYMRYMATHLRTVRKTEQVNKYGRCNWELGEDPTLPTPDQVLDASFAPRRRMVPARQMGMGRDYFVAAFFGPAGEQRT
jgi:hypothetical protein